MIEKHMTKFVMYSGLRTIGGVIASVTYGKDRVILEFGSAYEPSKAVFDGIVESRADNWVRDMLKIGILPRIDGIYRRQDLGKNPLISAEESDLNTAIFITHLHLDHMALMGTVAPEIPIYLHHNAQVIERALEAIGKGVQTLDREYFDIVPNQSIHIGAIEVLPLLCKETGHYDFSFLITTPDGTIHWTGDLCLHGLQADKTWAQMELLKSRNIDVLLCDGTSLIDSGLRRTYHSLDVSLIKPDRQIPPGVQTEQQYKDTLFERISNCKGLCVFNYYQREMDEAGEYIDWAKRCGRQCVFEPDAAYLVYKFFHIQPHVYIPDSYRYQSKDTPGWFVEIMNNSVVVTNEQICANPAGYLLQNSYRHILELLSLPSEEGIYLHEGGEPLGDFDPAFANMHRALSKTGFTYVSSEDTFFGHAYPGQAKYFVDQIDPKVLIPCHTYNPERLLPNTGKQLLPEYYQTYILKDHQLTLEADQE